MYPLTTRLDIIFVDSTGTAQDVSNYLFRPSRDTLTAQFALNNQLLIGYAKPLPGALYIDVERNNQSPISGQLEYFTGVATNDGFTVVPGQDDQTNSLTEPGFIQWENRIIQDDFVKTTIQSKNRYWYRIIINDSTVGDRVINFMNLIFNDDDDLLGFYSGADNFVDAESSNPAARTNLLMNVKARDIILRELDKRGLRKELEKTAEVPEDDGITVALDQFDIFSYADFRDAAACLSLSLILRTASHEAGDVYSDLSDRYYSLYVSFMVSGRERITIDYDDDGLEEEYEKEGTDPKGYFEFFL